MYFIFSDKNRGCVLKIYDCAVCAHVPTVRVFLFWRGRERERDFSDVTLLRPTWIM